VAAKLANLGKLSRETAVSLRHNHLKLLVAALVLPIILVLLLATSRLLAALGDAVAATVLDRIALAAGLIWVANLVGLVIVQGILTAEHAARDDVIEDEDLSAGYEPEEP
jgi:hypothetical protein